MNSLVRTGFRSTLACLLLIGGIWNTAQAQLTPADTTITNRATVNYSVGTVPQTEIESSPTGNTTPGATFGEDTEFLVDQVVDLTVTALAPEVPASPGGIEEFATYTVTNTGNEDQGYFLVVTEETGTPYPFLGAGSADNYDIGLANLTIYVDEGPLGAGGNGTYDGTETSQDFIDALSQGETMTVFVLADIQAASSLDFANVNLEAQTAVAGTSGATLESETSNGANTLTLDIIFGDEDAPQGTDYDGAADATHQFAIVSAELRVTKSAVVISDPFGTSPPVAVPGAIVEYSILIENLSAATVADSVAINDLLPANTTFAEVVTAYEGGPNPAGTNVLIEDGAAAGCIAEDGADTPAVDGCFRNAAGELIVGAAAIGSVAASPDSVTVHFRVVVD